MNAKITKEEWNHIRETLNSVISELQSKYPSIRFALPDARIPRWTGMYIGDSELERIMGNGYPNVVASELDNSKGYFSVVRIETAPVYDALIPKYSVEQTYYFGSKNHYNDVKFMDLAERFRERTGSFDAQHVRDSKRPFSKYRYSCVSTGRGFDNLDIAVGFIVNCASTYIENAKDYFQRKRR